MNRIDLSRFDSIPAYEPETRPFRLKLDANESFVSPGPALRARIAALAAELPYNRYPDPYAEKLCAAFGRAYGVDPRCLTVGNGSDELISLVIGTLLTPGQQAYVCDPDFSMYKFYAQRAGIRCAQYEKRDGVELAVDEAARGALETGSSLVVFSNPCNPTGRGVPLADVERLLTLLPGLAVVVDEAYMDFWDQSALPLVGKYENLIVLRTLSKALGMAALRVGFAAAGAAVTAVLKKAKSPYNVTGLSQEIGTMMLEGGWRDACVAEILSARDGLQARMEELAKQYPALLRARPSTTNFAVLESPRAKEIFLALKEKGVAIRFTEGLLRVTAGSPEENGAFAGELAAVLRTMEGEEA